MRRLVDSHAHMESFSDPGTITRESVEAGVDAVICVGSDIESSITALELAKSFPEFYYPCIGVHPAEVLKTKLNEVEDFVSSRLSECVALGEVGLDYFYDFARPEEIRSLMRNVFKGLLGLAAEEGVPASVHSRSAYEDALELVMEAEVEAVFHWYDGPIHTLHKLLDAGFYVSATPAVEYSKGVQRVMRETPLERILVETDSPVFLRSLERNSRPMDVLRVVEALAELKDLDAGDVALAVTRNTERLFGV